MVLGVDDEARLTSILEVLRSSLECPCCAEAYDVDARAPFMLPACGHTYCRMCVLALQEGRGTCTPNVCYQCRTEVTTEALPVKCYQMAALVESTRSLLDVMRDNRRARDLVSSGDPPRIGPRCSCGVPSIFNKTTGQPSGRRGYVCVLGFADGCGFVEWIDEPTDIQVPRLGALATPGPRPSPAALEAASAQHRQLDSVTPASKRRRTSCTTLNFDGVPGASRVTPQHVFAAPSPRPSDQSLVGSPRPVAGGGDVPSHSSEQQAPRRASQAGGTGSALRISAVRAGADTLASPAQNASGAGTVPGDDASAALRRQESPHAGVAPLTSTRGVPSPASPGSPAGGWPSLPRSARRVSVAVQSDRRESICSSAGEPLGVPTAVMPVLA